MTPGKPDVAELMRQLHDLDDQELTHLAWAAVTALARRRDVGVLRAELRAIDDLDPAE